jgi:hypothetical protein
MICRGTFELQIAGIFFNLKWQKNSNEYLLEVTDEYDSKDDPTAVHDMIEVWIDVIFSDGNRIEGLIKYQDSIY